MVERFAAHYPGHPEPRVFRAPGRVNLIGEHTDYNLGFVMPIALEMNCLAATAPGDDRCLRVYSAEEDEMRCISLDTLATRKSTGEKDWCDYIVGVAQQLLEAGYEISSLRVYLHSTVPVGSGLSSSAALEVSTALALLQGREIDPKELAKLCQRAENRYVGVPSGIMDQYASIFGHEGGAIRLDCRALTHEVVPIPESVEILAVNTMVKHSLGSSAYGQRVAECQEAVEILRRKLPQVESLRDVTPDQVEGARGDMSDVVYRRARHVTYEIERVVTFTAAAKNEDLESMGRLFVESHRSLQRDYEVSCEELDFLVDRAIELPYVLGARMTGGGFGGCTVNLVRSGHREEFAESLVRAYSDRYGIDAPVYRCIPSAGANEVF
jgi:galactokinase